MKRPITFLILFLYLIPSIGISMDLHWCGKKVKVISLYASHKEKCPCGVKMPSNCCKDAHISVQLKDAQKKSNESVIPIYPNSFVFSFPVFVMLGEAFSQKEVFEFSSYHAPPFKIKPVYIVNNNFRI